MRKILLGTTALLGAAVFAPTVAEAQEAPTVRIGGYFRAYYGNTQQSGGQSAGVLQSGSGPADGGLLNNNATANFGTNPGALQGSNATIGGVNQAINQPPQSARLGKNDFSADAEVQVFVNGKTANGLAYGAVIEIEFDTSEGTVRSDARRAFTRKTGAAIDEYWAFLSSPTLGTIRFGDEDGPFGGLMNVGWVSNFGTGGAFGEFESFVVRPVRTGTTPGGVGDNTKIIYLSPQFFGFDAGVSFAFNEGEGEDTGCLDSFASINCDRAYAVTNAAGNGRAQDQPGRTDEFQGYLRWRGNIAGIGLQAGFGAMLSGVIKEADALTGDIRRTLRNPQVFQAGLQASAYGFTVGGGYMWGNTNFFYIPTVRGDKDMSQVFGGVSYTAGPFTIGANTYFGSYAGAAANFAPGGNQRGQRRWAYSVGANYRLAPGLDLIAEYVRQEFKEPGVGQQGFGSATFGINNISDRAKASVFLTGVRLAF